MASKVKVIESPSLSKGYENRYIIIDAETGEILDNAQRLRLPFHSESVCGVCL